MIEFSHFNRVLRAGMVLFFTIGTVLVVLNPACVFAAQGEQEQRAMAFIERMADRTMDLILDETLGQEQKKAEFKELLRQDFDMEIIARFVLGRYWRAATVEQRQEYTTLFREMIADVYASRFDDYDGQSFVVTGARPDGNDDLMVSSHIKNQDDPEVPVEWRVRERNGQSKIVDVIVNDVSMVVTKRSDFASVIQRGGGNVEVLLKHLREKTGN